MENKLTFRNAECKDTGLILQFIKELAAYEKMLDQVVEDEETLETWFVCQTRMPRQRIWQGNTEKAGIHCG